MSKKKCIETIFAIAFDSIKTLILIKRIYIFSYGNGQSSNTACFSLCVAFSLNGCPLVADGLKKKLFAAKLFEKLIAVICF